MDLGAILLPASTAERHPAVLVGTPQRNTEIIAILPVRGASTAIPSTAEARLAPAAAHRPMTMLTTAILMVHGQKQTMRSTSARKPARFVRLPVKNTLTMWIPTATASATIAAQRFR